ncbi:IclR family transcriptional regulator [Actinomadura viridis]|uniref:DNA-binding IclR family transcriptional regulator n=1 Tax=Actinomadura viridis TaxID=58110 RepID=A0A931GNH6_9ACTN|nr:IclR family transcriptional regulator C-terminal domain-containing protein [Actinomadura viridis]MBG6092975.1 DNA-binding IclR family transcriptional regulator [Actinomadura viridis]
MPAKHHRTVDRVVTILEVVARSASGLTLTELAQELEAAKSSVQELTNGLVATGYLIEDRKRYRLGPGPYVLTLAGQRSPARLVGHDDLVALAERTGTIALLAIRLGDAFVYVDETAVNGRIDFYARSRRRRPLLRAAAGRVILADLDPAERDDLLRTLEDSRPDDVDRFLRELPGILERGYAVTHEESVPGIHAIAAPLHDRQGRFLAAITLTVESDGDLIDSLGPELLATIEEWRAR